MKLFDVLGSVRENLYWRVAKRIASVMLLFSVMRLLFFLKHRHFFPDLSWEHYTTLALGGVKFDLTAVLYTNIIYILMFIVPFQFRYNAGYQLFAKIIFILTNSFALFWNCFDMVYFNYVRRRATATVFKEFAQETGRTGDFAGQFLVDFWPIFLTLFIGIACLFWFYGKPILRPKTFYRPLLYYPICVVLMLGLTGLTVGGLRGGFGEDIRPITLQNAGDYANTPLEMAIVLNNPFCLYKTLENTELEAVSYMNDSLASAIHPTRFSPKPTEAFRPMNVVVIVVESLSQEFIGKLNPSGYKSYTPFLDSLVGKSKTFWWSFANGERSIDALPSTVASIPNVQDPFVTSSYSGNKVHSLGWHLRKKGYHTSFFQGSPNGSMGLWAFMSLAGYEHYFGKNEYNNDADFDGMWGIWDEPYLQHFSQKLGTFPEPFHSTIFTLTSHHPFKIPEKYQQQFPANGPTEFHHCMRYADLALRKFFETSSKQPWFKNTLFVLTGDHTNGQVHREYKSDLGFFRVPVLFYQPSDPGMSGCDSTLYAQQIDVMPTVLGYLNYDAPFHAFGKDLFTKKTTNWAFQYINHTYQYCFEDYLAQYRGGKLLRVHHFKKDPLLAKNLLGQDTARDAQLLLRTKAFIQQYHTQMRGDGLTE